MNIFSTLSLFCSKQTFIRCPRQDSINDDSATDQIRAISAFAKEIFIGLTDEELNNAASEDVIANFKQLTRMANKLVGSKNA